MGDRVKPGTVAAEAGVGRLQRKGSAAQVTMAGTSTEVVTEVSVPLQLVVGRVGAGTQAGVFQIAEMPSNADADDATASNPALPNTETYLPAATREAVAVGFSVFEGRSKHRPAEG
jgi:hypothetical protein